MVRAFGCAAALGITMAALALSGCGSAADHGASVSRATLTYTCCKQADIAPVRHPGETVRVHWIAVDEPPSAPSTTADVTLSASLAGPYADVKSLKATSFPVAVSAATAQPIHTTGSVRAVPVSTLVIPADAGSGFYNLTTTVEAGGGTVSGGSIIRVAAP